MTVTGTEENLTA